MQSSASKPRPNKLPPSQLIGFVKRHKAPPTVSGGLVNKAEVLPKIPPSPKSRQPEQQGAVERTRPPVMLGSVKEVKKMSAEATKKHQWKRTSPDARQAERRTLADKLRPLDTGSQGKEQRSEDSAGRAAAEVSRTVGEVREVSLNAAPEMSVPFRWCRERRRRHVLEKQINLWLAQRGWQRMAFRPLNRTHQGDTADCVCAPLASNGIQQHPQKKAASRGYKREMKGKSECESVSMLSSTKTADTHHTDTENSTDQSKAKVEKSPEECQQQAEAKVQKCLNIANLTHMVPAKSPDSPLYLKEFMLHLKSIRQTYFTFKGLPLPLIRKSRLEVAEGMLTSGTVRILCDTVSAISQAGQLSSEETTVAKNHRQTVLISLTTLMNYSDCSDNVTYTLRDHPSFLQAVLTWLQEWKEPHFAKEFKKVMEHILRTCMSTIHNVSMREDNVHRLRELNATNILLPYLESHDDIFRLSAYATLADIVSEEEADKLSTSPHLARFLLKRLENALKSKDHRCYGWSVKELVRAVRRLARNDANKRLLVEQGALPLLSEGIKSTFEDERMGCMEAVWVLSFDKQNMTEIMKHDELFSNIIQISTDYSQPLALRHSAAGILWQCRNEMMKTEKYCEIGKTTSKTRHRKRKPKTTEPSQQGQGSLDGRGAKVGGKVEEKAEDDKEEEEGLVGHVMLSYQWGNQEVVKQIRDVLREHGYKVWMDIDNMGGSTLQAMAAAVEEAFVVLICMSQKYKDSPNTRAEAEYAFQQRKAIIPLIMERSYRPDGWLGMILGAKLFYDFSGKYSFESRVDGLLKALAAASGHAKGDEDTDGKHHGTAEQPTVVQPKEPVKGVAANRTTAPPVQPSVSVDTVKAWSTADVKSWLRKYGLNGTELERLTGKEIVFLKGLRAEAPEFFYRTLDKKLHITTLSGLISFTEALQDLPGL